MGGFGSSKSAIGTQFGTVESRAVASRSVMEAISHMSSIKKKVIIPATITREEQRDTFIDFGNTGFFGVSGNDFGKKLIGCAGNESSGSSKSAQGSSSGSAGKKSGGSARMVAVSSGLNSKEDDDEGDESRKKKVTEKFDAEETLTAEEVVEEDDDDDDGNEEVAFPSSQIRGSQRNAVSLQNVDDQSSDDEEESETVPSSEAGADDEDEDHGADLEGDDDDVGGGGDDQEADQDGDGPNVDNVETSSEGNFVWKSSKDINQDTYPMKSKASYREAYGLFQRFLKANGRFVEGVCPSEEDIQNYFSYLHKDRHLASSTIWCTSAKLNACLKREFGIKLQNFPCISELLKSFETGRVVKKAKIFSPQEVN